MDQTIRNKLRGVVTQCRKLLEDSTAQAFQGRFGIYPSRKKGEVQIEHEARMAHLTEDDRACRQDLLDHLEHIRAIGYKPSEALERLVREIAFTHLNRLCAYKMMEFRGLIREAVSRGLKSQGFFFYLADHPEAEKVHNSGQQDMAYRNFLDWLGGTLSQEIGVLFNPNDPANRIYPPRRVLDEVLALINDGELKDIWFQDETIGWVYQYFTPKELRDKARKESQAPRNSYELAFRNQFFTPRYVVEFLTDNTLARIWYEMRKGKTVLKDRCKYLVRRPSEIFLKEGEQPPAESKEAREDLSQEELLKQPVFIPHRSKKDPRELKVLDPACGSGHFVLYCFDLLQTIYEEAYDDPDLCAALRADYPAIDDLRRAVPGLILKHNLHGIDIDLRATQIAALALWLRCQRAYQDLGLTNGERPKITRSNIVCAEPMPGETDLLKEFTTTLQPKVLGQLVETIFEKMKLAGEAGSLLKIEDEIRDAADKAKFEFIQWKKHQDKAKWSLFPEMVERDQPSIFDFTDMTDEEFIDRVEDEIVAALRQYAEEASNGRGFRKRLFAEDARRGFSFVDVCNKRYDVVLMNPPFGLSTETIFRWLEKDSIDTYVEIYASFVARGIEFAPSGLVGAITSRGFMMMSRLANWRRRQIIPTMDLLLDLGQNIMDDAYVESCAYVLNPHRPKQLLLALDLRDKNEPSKFALNNFWTSTAGDGAARFYGVPKSRLLTIPDGRLLYSMGEKFAEFFRLRDRFEPEIGTVRKGLTTFDDFRFLRLAWEIPPRLIGRDVYWERFVKGGEFAKYYTDIHLVVNRRDKGSELAEANRRVNGQEAQSRQGSKYYYRPGGFYTSRSAKGFSVRAMPEDCVMASNSPSILSESEVPSEFLVGWANSRLIRTAVEYQSHFSDYIPGVLKNMPWCEPNEDTHKIVKTITMELIRLYRSMVSWVETDPNFVYFDLCAALKEVECFWAERVRETRRNIIDLQKQISRAVDSQYQVESEEFSLEVLGSDPDLDVPLEAPTSRDISESVVSYSVGCAVGRWDVRLCLGTSDATSLPDPFDPIPVCPPGMLQSPDGFPAKPEDVPSEYPIRIPWNGILVDDPGHEDDIIRRVQGVLEVIWKDRAEAIEKEACEILGVRELRDYFRKPGNGGFWIDHVKRYSKSRRKAPIYWYLRSAKGKYGLWLYYHRLDKDILFKALLNYMEPKIRLEEDRLKSLRSRKEAAGSSGREAKQIEKDMDRQDQLVSELHDFADKLRRAANLYLVPDLNDGVVLNIAPLFELVPWKEAKDYWEDLVAGKYEWSSIGKQMREKGLVKK